GASTVPISLGGNAVRSTIATWSGGGFLAGPVTPLTLTVWLSTATTAISAAAGDARSRSPASAPPNCVRSIVSSCFSGALVRWIWEEDRRICGGAGRALGYTPCCRGTAARRRRCPAVGFVEGAVERDSVGRMVTSSVPPAARDHHRFFDRKAF